MDLEVKLIEDPETAEFGHCMGITEERLEEILNMMEIDFDPMDSVPIQIAKRSRIAKHPNELAFLCFVIGVSYEQSRNPFSGLAALFNAQK